MTIDHTHSPDLTSWVPASTPSARDFPIQNLPLGRFHTQGQQDSRMGVAIGDCVLDLLALAQVGGLSNDLARWILCAPSSHLNALMAAPPTVMSALRHELSALLAAGAPRRKLVERCLVERDQAVLDMPVDIRNFSDFFTSVNHAENSGKMKRPDNPLLPNFHSLPIGYHGRASTVVLSDVAFSRPWGQQLDASSGEVQFAPSRALDLECELGVFVRQGNALGTQVPLEQAEDHIFGLCVLNDWSLRDVQNWESVPLGPFLAKSALTTISPWVVTLEAVAPFRCAAAPRRDNAPPLLPHLHAERDRAHGGVDIRYTISLQTPGMREQGMAPQPILTPHFKEQYWTIFQLLAHHTSNGCAMLPGDLLGTGTISGSTDAELGCLMELTLGGKKPFRLTNGETRTYLEDGDELIISAHCERSGFVPIGFGEARTRILPHHA